MNYNVIELWDLFKSSLQLGISQFIPSKLVKKRPSLPWMNRELAKLVKKKNKLFKKAKNSGNWSDFKIHQKKCKKEFQKAEYDYINKTIQDGLGPFHVTGVTEFFHFRMFKLLLLDRK